MLGAPKLVLIRYQRVLGSRTLARFRAKAVWLLDLLPIDERADLSSAVLWATTATVAPCTNNALAMARLVPCPGSVTSTFCTLRLRYSEFQYCIKLWANQVW